MDLRDFSVGSSLQTHVDVHCVSESRLLLYVYLVAVRR